MINEFPSPLRYPGGKSRIFPFVSKLLCENDIVGASYAEPYAGGAGLALRLLFREYVDKIYINDFDLAIYSFWKAVLEEPYTLCSWIAEVKVDLENWRRYKQIYVNSGSASGIDLAKATFFLNRTNVSGIIKGGMIGGIAQSSKYKIDARFYRRESIERIKRIAAMRHRICLSNLDGISFVDKLNSRKENVFIYLDPPYYQKSSDLYLNHYVESDHKKLARHVRKIQKRWMVSYDKHEFILNLYPANPKVRHSLSRGASNKTGDEILIFSNNLKFQTSTMSLKSACSI